MKILLRSNSLPVLQSMHNTFVQDQVKKEGKKNTAMSVFCEFLGSVCTDGQCCTKLLRWFQGKDFLITTCCSQRGLFQLYAFIQQLYKALAKSIDDVGLISGIMACVYRF